MADKSSNSSTLTSSSWAEFKVPPGGSSNDIRKRVADIQSRVSEEKKIFASASLVNGGTKTK